MVFSPNSITEEHILNAVKKIENERISLIPSTKYEVIINEKRYPPKEILRYAHEQFNGEKVLDYHGGKPVNRIFERLGFNIVTKTAEESLILKLIEDYKSILRKNRLEGEIYKWELVKKYRGRPDLNADDIYGELKSINYSNLMFHTAKAVSLHIAKEKPDEYRQQLKDLFDEAASLSRRVENFISETLRIYRELEDIYGTHHDERTISAFLTYSDPTKYTFFKDSFYKKYCSFIGISPQKKGGKYSHYLELIDDLINGYFVEDSELLELVEEILPDNVFDDANHLILAQDFLYQSFDKNEPVIIEPNSSRKYWLYAPGENARFWDEFYENGIMAIGWEYLGDLSNYQTKKEIADRLDQIENETRNRPNDSLANFQFADEINIGDIIIPKRGKWEYLGYGIVVSDYYFDDSRENYKSCRKVAWKKNGVWREVSEGGIVLKTLTDITSYSDYVEQLKNLIGIEQTEPEIDEMPNLPNEKIALNQILYGPPGTGKTYNTIGKAVEIISGKTAGSHGENKKIFDELRRKGQIEFVTFHQNYSYEDFVVGIKPDVEFEQLRFNPHKGIFYEIARKSRENFEASKEFRNQERDFDAVFQEIILPLETGREVEIKMKSGISFWITDVSGSSIYFRKSGGGTAHTLSIESLRDSVSGKRNPPSGLASYYSPLVELIKERKTIAGTTEVIKNFVLIIDEINRANISKVFGELITLLEDDKRLGEINELKVTLPNGEKDFGVPPNLYVIGTMNTADKSIALIDIALRRRFEFVGFYPDYDLIESEAADLLQAINTAIFERKKSADYLIGHAYFMQNNSIENVLEYKILPLLMEYFAGKTEIVSSLFDDTDWRVFYNPATYDWTIQNK